MTAHASGTQAHPCAKLFPHAHGTEPRQCLRGTAESVSDTAVVIQLKLPGSHTTDNLLISLGRREDEQNPGAVKEGCDLCPGRPSKLFVPHWGTTSSAPAGETEDAEFGAPARAQPLLKEMQLSAFAELMLWGLRQLEGLRVSCISQETASFSWAVLLLLQQDTCILPLPQGWLGTGRGSVSSLFSSWENASTASPISAWMLPFNRGTWPC